MKATNYLFVILLLCSSLISARGQQTVKDYDGNVYQTIKVGNQVWMAENLKTTHFRNGEAIPNVKDRKEWDALTTGAGCDISNNPAKSAELGRLYNWYVIADTRNVCPSGWHVPTEEEWQTLVKFVAESPDKKAINQGLFKILQEDFRGYDGDFSGNGYGGGGWWSSTAASPETAYYHGINYDGASKNRLEGRKKFGYSIRCIKD